MVRVFIAILWFVLAPSAAHAEKRIALLIGNKDYKPGVGALVNPLNDVRVVGEALKAVGFEVLKPVQNAGRGDMLLAIHEFAGKLKAAGPDAVGFLYYSGHGIASAGENYLIPVDMDEPSTVLLTVYGLKHSEVLAILRNVAPNAAHYLVLDACRNTLQGAKGGKGFVPVGQQSGVLVAFAAEPGKTADTGQGNGPYAAALAAELVKPAQNDLLMFHRVRVAVMDKTNGDQVPWTEDGIQRRERVQFGGKPMSALSALPSDADRAWSAVKDTSSLAVLEAFIARYKDTIYADLARARFETLKHAQVSVPAPARAPGSAPETATATGEPFEEFFNDFFNRKSGLGGLKLATLNDDLRAKHNIGKNLKGVIVLEVGPRSSAAEKGIKVGDLVVEAAQEKVAHMSDLVMAINKVKDAGRKAVLLRLDDGKGDLRFVTVPVQ
jgi:hypothetical protein